MGTADTACTAGLLLAAIFSFPCLSLSQSTHKCSPNSIFRELNGRCTSVVDPTWGASGKVLTHLDSSNNDRRSPPLPSSFIAEQPEIQDPVTDWLGAWTSFIKSDLLNVREDYRGLINMATPVLDLSNLYGTSGDTVNIDPRIIGETWDVNEKVLWKLLEAEHYRLSEDLATLNPGWGTNKIHQEARKILIGEYQNILINEALPLLLGSRLGKVQQATSSNKTEALSSSELLSGVHGDLAMGASELNYLDLAQQPLDSIWHEATVRMLDLHLLVPGGGVTMEKLTELSDTLDTLQNVDDEEKSETLLECRPFALISDIDLSRYNDEVVTLLEGLLEEQDTGALLSSTLACLLEKVLEKIVSGDRFWYTKSTAFSHGQISALKRVSLSSLICTNLPFVNSIQPNAFLQVDDGLNAAVLCRNIPDLDLVPWLSEDFEMAESEEIEVDQAIRAATDRLLEFRRYEYDLFTDNFVASRGSSFSALNAVTRPSIKVRNLMNTSALFELVTYEFKRRPRLSTLIDSKTTPRRIKRSVGVLNTVFPITPVNLAFDNRVKSSLNQISQEKIYYKSVSSRRRTIPSNFEPVASNSISNNNRKLTFEISTRGSESGQCDPSEELSSCDQFSRYRSYSGWCNNKRRPEWGTSMSVHNRLLPSEYNDKISSPRTVSVRGSKLPSSRLVSQTVHYDISNPDPKYTLMLMQWGQFVDHDLTHTPMLRGFHNTILECGSCESKNVHPACFPIKIPEHDDFYTYNPVDPKCIPFSRSVFGQQTLGPREQINQLTSYLDASMVYGSNECEMRRLRETGTYYMKTFVHPLNSHTHKYKDLLPRTREAADCFSPTGECFMAGDSRVNEQPGLACMHTIIIREHNKIAEKLAGVNTHWDVNKVFEETRRIISAEIQHITYNEFLPRVLGLNNLNLFDLDLRTSDYFYDYDESCSATSFTEFSTAAFRFGHSMIRPNLTVMSEAAMLGRSSPKEMSLRQLFNKPDVLMEADMIDDMLRGLAMMPMETTDNSVTEEVTNHLFEQKKPQSGMDLVALNIQRGRDHGIPGYNKYREVCQLSRAQYFIDLKGEIRIEMINKLQKVYKHPDDIDLFTGLLAETRLPGALTGPTLACLIGLQFKHLRKCDRYWYETSDPDIRFTPEQLKEVRSTSLAALICANMDKDTKISRSTMDQMDRLTNPLVDCKTTIKHINIEAWREKPSPFRPSVPATAATFSSNVVTNSETSENVVGGSESSVVSSSHIISKDETGSTSHRTVCQIRDQSVLIGNRYRISPCTTCLCTEQGVKCETVSLSEYGSSCLQLVKEFGIKKVEEDESCRPQCRII